MGSRIGSETMMTNNIDVRDILSAAPALNEKIEINSGYYQPAAFSIADAQNRQSFLIETIRMLDSTMQHSGDCSTMTRRMYNDLRGMMLNLIDVEHDAVKAGLMR